MSSKQLINTNLHFLKVTFLHFYVPQIPNHSVSVQTWLKTYLFTGFIFLFCYVSPSLGSVSGATGRFSFNLLYTDARKCFDTCFQRLHVMLD